MELDNKQQEINSVDLMGNKFNAAMNHMTTEEYVNGCNSMLQELNDLKRQCEKDIKTVDDYRNASMINSMLNTLYTYTFNNKNPAYDTVIAIVTPLLDKLYNYAKDYNKITEKEIRACAKYVITCAGRYFTYEDVDRIIMTLLNDNRLFKDKNGDYFITGLHYSIGDNTFTVNETTGHNDRVYTKTGEIQAFQVNYRWTEIIHVKNIDKYIPLLSNIYDKTLVCTDCKGTARVYLSKNDKVIITKQFCTQE